MYKGRAIDHLLGGVGLMGSSGRSAIIRALRLPVNRRRPSRMVMTFICIRKEGFSILRRAVMLRLRRGRCGTSAPWSTACGRHVDALPSLRAKQALTWVAYGGDTWSTFG